MFTALLYTREDTQHFALFHYYRNKKQYNIITGFSVKLKSA